MKLECVGGPLDGVRAGAVSGAYAWIDDRGRATAKPTNRRALYQRANGEDRPVYLYAGHRIYYCNGCGAYHGKREGGRERAGCPLRLSSTTAQSPEREA